MQGGYFDDFFDLVRIDSQNPGTDYSEISGYLAGKLKSLGGNVRMHNKNILATWGNPTLAINAHMDTVAAINLGKTNPLKPKSSDGKIFGLGTADTKGNIFALLKAIEILGKDSDPNLMVIFSTDEEVGKNTGAEECILKGYFQGIHNAIVLEPTSNLVASAHPGYCEFNVKSPMNTTGHSSIAKSQQIVKTFGKIAQLEKTVCKGKLAVLSVGSSAKENGNAECAIRFCIRSGLPPKKVNSIVNGLFDSEKIKAIQLALPFSNPKPFPKCKKHDVPFWSDAANFQYAGINTVVYGAGSISQAHKPGEFVTEESIRKAVGFISSAIRCYG